MDKKYFINDNFKHCVKEAEVMSQEKQMQVITDYPEALKHFAGLIMLFNKRNLRKINIDDWECDIENHLLR